MEYVLIFIIVVALWFIVRSGLVGIGYSKVEKIAIEVDLADEIAHHKKLNKLKAKAESLDSYTSAKEIKKILAGKAQA